MEYVAGRVRIEGLSLYLWRGLIIEYWESIGSSLRPFRFYVSVLFLRSH